jgi:hypothetical protein
MCEAEGGFHEPTMPNLAQPRWGCEHLPRQTQGSLASSATLGFEAESLWDSKFGKVLNGQAL